MITPEPQVVTPPEFLYVLGYGVIAKRNEDGTYSEDSSGLPDERLLLEISRAGLDNEMHSDEKLSDVPEGTQLKLVPLDFKAPGVDESKLEPTTEKFIQNPRYEPPPPPEANPEQVLVEVATHVLTGVAEKLGGALSREIPRIFHGGDHTPPLPQRPASSIFPPAPLPKPPTFTVRLKV